MEWNEYVSYADNDEHVEADHWIKRLDRRQRW